MSDKTILYFMFFGGFIASAFSYMVNLKPIALILAVIFLVVLFIILYLDK